MNLEIMCCIFTAYIFLFAEWTFKAFDNIIPANIIWLLEVIYPKATGILIVLYLVLKYILKVGD